MKLWNNFSVCFRTPWRIRK